MDWNRAEAGPMLLASPRARSTTYTTERALRRLAAADEAISIDRGGTLPAGTWAIEGASLRGAIGSVPRTALVATQGKEEELLPARTRAVSEVW